MKNPMHQIIAGIMTVLFGINTLFVPISFAQVPFLPAAGAMVGMTPAYNPLSIKGIHLYPDNPFNFDFIVDPGDTHLSQAELKAQGQRLIGYFLASLTTPEKEMWVNLSPFEKERIIPKTFGQTEMGKELLGQDYLLKQIMATALYPERQLGQQFWARVYSEAQTRFGTTNVPVSTFNKVWILPDKAVVYENAKSNSVFVVQSTLKVMLEQDYLALRKNIHVDQSDVSALGSQVIREIVIPALEKEVNEGKNFAPLRQVYQSLILAAWYKKNLKDNIIARAYVNQGKIKGVDVADQNITQEIYKQYLQAYRKGVYNYIKEDIDTSTQSVIPRKYFSGGMSLYNVNPSMTSDMTLIDRYVGIPMINFLIFSAKLAVPPIKAAQKALKLRFESIRSKINRTNVFLDAFYKNQDEIGIINEFMTSPFGVVTEHLFKDANLPAAQIMKALMGDGENGYINTHGGIQQRFVNLGSYQALELPDDLAKYKTSIFEIIKSAPRAGDLIPPGQYKGMYELLRNVQSRFKAIEDSLGWLGGKYPFTSTKGLYAFSRRVDGYYGAVLGIADSKKYERVAADFMGLRQQVSQLAPYLFEIPTSPERVLLENQIKLVALEARLNDIAKKIGGLRSEIEKIDDLKFSKEAIHSLLDLLKGYEGMVSIQRRHVHEFHDTVTHHLSSRDVADMQGVVERLEANLTMVRERAANLPLAQEVTAPLLPAIDLEGERLMLRGPVGLAVQGPLVDPLASRWIGHNSQRALPTEAISMSEDAFLDQVVGISHVLIRVFRELESTEKTLKEAVALRDKQAEHVKALEKRISDNNLINFTRSIYEPILNSERAELEKLKAQVRDLEAKRDLLMAQFDEEAGKLGASSTEGQGDNNRELRRIINSIDSKRRQIASIETRIAEYEAQLGVNQPVITLKRDGVDLSLEDSLAVVKGIVGRLNTGIRGLTDKLAKAKGVADKAREIVKGVSPDTVAVIVSNITALYQKPMTDELLAEYVALRADKNNPLTEDEIKTQFSARLQALVNEHLGYASLIKGLGGVLPQGSLETDFGLPLGDPKLVEAALKAIEEKYPGAKVQGVEAELRNEIDSGFWAKHPNLVRVWTGIASYLSSMTPAVAQVVTSKVFVVGAGVLLIGASAGVGGYVAVEHGYYPHFTVVSHQVAPLSESVGVAPKTLAAETADFERSVRQSAKDFQAEILAAQAKQRLALAMEPARASRPIIREGDGASFIPAFEAPREAVASAAPPPEVLGYVIDARLGLINSLVNTIKQNPALEKALRAADEANGNNQAKVSLTTLVYNLSANKHLRQAGNPAVYKLGEPLTSNVITFDDDLLKLLKGKGIALPKVSAAPVVPPQAAFVSPPPAARQLLINQAPKSPAAAVIRRKVELETRAPVKIARAETARMVVSRIKTPDLIVQVPAPNTGYGPNPRERLPRKFRDFENWIRQGRVAFADGRAISSMDQIPNGSVLRIKGSAGGAPSNALSFTDRAMRAEILPTAVEVLPKREGGIDLQNVDVSSTGGGVRTAFSDPAQLQALMDADGLEAVVYKIQPMTAPMMNMLLGFNVSGGSAHA